jgi:uncharacterized protein YecT (DUF1311 family)
MNYRFLLTAAALLAASPLHAQQASAEHVLQNPYHHCLLRAGQNPVQQGMCVQAELSRQDARLNFAYQHLMKNYKPSSVTAGELRVEQRAWLKERDTACKLNGDTVDNVCLVDRTTKRADELEMRLAH